MTGTKLPLFCGILLCAFILYGTLLLSSCAAPYKPRGCGCGMEEHRRSR